MKKQSVIPIIKQFMEIHKTKCLKHFEKLSESIEILKKFEVVSYKSFNAYSYKRDIDISYRVVNECLVLINILLETDNVRMILKIFLRDYETSITDNMKLRNKFISEEEREIRLSVFNQMRVFIISKFSC